MKRTWFYAEVIPGGGIPHRWLGAAWPNWDRDTTVFLPIPFNVLFGWLRDRYYALRIGSPSTAMDRWREKWYALGYKHGRVRGANDERNRQREERTMKAAAMSIEEGVWQMWLSIQRATGADARDYEIHAHPSVMRQVVQECISMHHTFAPGGEITLHGFRLVRDPLMSNETIVFVRKDADHRRRLP